MGAEVTKHELMASLAYSMTTGGWAAVVANIEERFAHTFPDTVTVKYGVEITATSYSEAQRLIDLGADAIREAGLPSSVQYQESPEDKGEPDVDPLAEEKDTEDAPEHGSTIGWMEQESLRWLREGTVLRTWGGGRFTSQGDGMYLLEGSSGHPISYYAFSESAFPMTVGEG